MHIDEKSDGDRLREALRAVVRRGRGRPYPAALRNRVVAFAEQRRSAGVSAERIAGEVGLPAWTLTRWLARKPAFVPVEIVQSVEPVAPRIVVHGPRGLRIEGLDLGAVVELVARLS